MPAESGHALLSDLSAAKLRKVVHALLLEWTSVVEVSDRGTFIDFDADTIGVLGLPVSQRFRLYFSDPEATDLRQLSEESEAVGRLPVAITASTSPALRALSATVPIIGAEQLSELCDDSGLIIRDAVGLPTVDRIAFGELKDHSDAKFSLVNGLLWLRPLSRNTLPPALRWTGTAAHELFERCFFLTMCSTFQSQGISWGTRKRGKAIPDGVLELPNSGKPFLYDCKAYRDGYSMSFRDLTGFADYLRNPIEDRWACPEGVVPGFMVVSCEIHSGTRDASFIRRQAALQKRVPGSTLVWLRTPDLVRFALSIEAAEVTPSDRSSIQWMEILDAGDVRWESFETQLRHLTERGYKFTGVS